MKGSLNSKIRSNVKGIKDYFILIIICYLSSGI